MTAAAASVASGAVNASTPPTAAIVRPSTSVCTTDEATSVKATSEDCDTRWIRLAELRRKWNDHGTVR